MLFGKFSKIDEKEEAKKRKKKKEQDEFEASIMNSTVHSEIGPVDLKPNPGSSSKILPALQHLKHSAGHDGP